MTAWYGEFRSAVDRLRVSARHPEQSKRLWADAMRLMQCYLALPKHLQASALERIDGYLQVPVREGMTATIAEVVQWWLSGLLDDGRPAWVLRAPDSCEDDWPDSQETLAGLVAACVAGHSFIDGKGHKYTLAFWCNEGYGPRNTARSSTLTVTCRCQR